MALVRRRLRPDGIEAEFCASSPPHPSLNETEPAAPKTDAEHLVDKKLVCRVAFWSLSLAIQAHRVSAGAFL